MYYLLGVLGLVCLLLAVRLYSMDHNLRKGAEELRGTPRRLSGWRPLAEPAAGLVGNVQLTPVFCHRPAGDDAAPLRHALAQLLV